MSPLTSNWTRASPIRSGLLMNSGLNGATRNTACQAAIKIATARRPSSTLRCWLAKLWRGAASSGIGYTVISSLSSFQISSFSSLNSGVTRIS